MIECMKVKDRILWKKDIFLLLNLSLLLPKLKEDRHSKADTWLEAPGLPFRKEELQPAD